MAKTEFLLGLISCMTEAIGIEQFPHVQGDIAEVIVTLEQSKALVRAAEADAELNEFGVMTPAWAPLNANRNWYPKTYQRFPEIIRKLGASGLMALPTEADIEGDARDDIEAYLTSATLTGTERVRLFRLAWDIAISAFAGRQTLYEYYFFGDPVRMAGAFVGSVDREPYKQRVRDFLVRDDAAVATA
jgi:4-hydroxyphenylacetate 3-monooxygenase